MTIRYQKRHYENVARLLDKHHASPGMCYDFADLFAADNPLICRQCGDDEGSTARCLPDEPTVEHSYDGFDRRRFLSACGLESEE